VTTLDGAVDLARDRDLVERCQAGDEAAFADLYARYQLRLHRFCLRRVHAADDADEAVQEAFAKAWRALPRFGGERRFYPWLTVIAANVCTDILRRRSRTILMDEMPLRALEAPGPDVDDGLMRNVDLAMASEALGRLSDRHQRVLQLREATQLSAQRIAEREGLAVPAVDTLLWRARQAFKREFVALSEAGGLAAAVGVALGSLRRSFARLTGRLASWLPSPTRGPAGFVAAAALAGAVAVGGGVAVLASAPARPHGGSARAAVSAPGAARRAPLAPGAARGRPRTTGTGSSPAGGAASAGPRTSGATGAVSGAAAPATTAVQCLLTSVVGLLPATVTGAAPGTGTLGPLTGGTTPVATAAVTDVTAAVTKVTTAVTKVTTKVVTTVLTPSKGLSPSPTPLP
jgi:RNA polymerase sigma-70 factor (ECF subfamily)